MPEPVPLKEHVEALLAAHGAVHEQEGIARVEAATRIDARLEGLNELRTEVLTDRNRFVSKEAFDAKMEALEGTMSRMNEQIVSWKGQGKGLSQFASIVVGAAAFIATILAIYFALA